MAKGSTLTPQQAAALAAEVDEQVVAGQLSEPPEHDCCANCAFVRVDKGDNVLRCHRYPPDAFGSSATTSNCAWPVVLREQDCGEHRRKA